MTINTHVIFVIAATVSLLEVVHTVLVQKICIHKSEFHKILGRTGPGYYFFGLFWIAPTYRKYLTSGGLGHELIEFPTLVRLSKIEAALWYLMWIFCITAVAI